MYRKQKRPLTPVDGNLKCKGNKERTILPEKILQEIFNLVIEFKKTCDEVFSCERSSWYTVDENESELEDDVFINKNSHSDNDDFLAPEAMRQTSDKDETWSLEPISWSDDSNGSRTEGSALPHGEKILHSTAIDFNNKLPTHPISPYLEELINFSSIYPDDSESNEDAPIINFDELFERRKEQNSSSDSRLSHKSVNNVLTEIKNYKQDQTKSILHSTKLDSMNGSLTIPFSPPINQLEDLSPIRSNKKGTEELSSANPDKISFHINSSLINTERNGIVTKAGNLNDSKKLSATPPKRSKGNHKKNKLDSTKSNTKIESPTLPFSPCIEELSFPPTNRNKKSKHKESSARNPAKIGISVKCKNQNNFEKVEMPQKKVEDLTKKRSKRTSTPKLRKKSSKRQTKPRASKTDVEYEEVLKYKEYLKTLPIDDLSLRKWSNKK